MDSQYETCTNTRGPVSPRSCDALRYSIVGQDGGNFVAATTGKGVLPRKVAEVSWKEVEAVKWPLFPALLAIIALAGPLSALVSTGNVNIGHSGVAAVNTLLGLSTAAASGVFSWCLWETCKCILAKKMADGLEASALLYSNGSLPFLVHHVWRLRLSRAQRLTIIMAVGGYALLITGAILAGLGHARGNVVATEGWQYYGDMSAVTSAGVDGGALAYAQEINGKDSTSTDFGWIMAALAALPGMATVRHLREDVAMIVPFDSSQVVASLSASTLWNAGLRYHGRAFGYVVSCDDPIKEASGDYYGLLNVTSLGKVFSGGTRRTLWQDTFSGAGIDMELNANGESVALSGKFRVRCGIAAKWLTETYTMQGGGVQGSTAAQWWAAPVDMETSVQIARALERVVRLGGAATTQLEKAIIGEHYGLQASRGTSSNAPRLLTNLIMNTIIFAFHKKTLPTATVNVDLVELSGVAADARAAGLMLAGVLLVCLAGAWAANRVLGLQGTALLAAEAIEIPLALLRAADRVPVAPGSCTYGVGKAVLPCRLRFGAVGQHICLSCVAGPVNPEVKYAGVGQVRMTERGLVGQVAIAFRDSAKAVINDYPQLGNSATAWMLRRWYDEMDDEPKLVADMSILDQVVAHQLMSELPGPMRRFSKFNNVAWMQDWVEDPVPSTSFHATVIPSGGGKSTLCRYFGYMDTDHCIQASRCEGAGLQLAQHHCWEAANLHVKLIIAQLTEPMHVLAHSPNQLPAFYTWSAACPSERLHELALDNRSAKMKAIGYMNRQHVLTLKPHIYNEWGELTDLLLDIAAKQQRRVPVDLPLSYWLAPITNSSVVKPIGVKVCHLGTDCSGANGGHFWSRPEDVAATYSVLNNVATELRDLPAWAQGDRLSWVGRARSWPAAADGPPVAGATVEAVPGATTAWAIGGKEAMAWVVSAARSQEAPDGRDRLVRQRQAIAAFMAATVRTSVTVILKEEVTSPAGLLTPLPTFMPVRELRNDGSECPSTQASMLHPVRGEDKRWAALVGLVVYLPSAAGRSAPARAVGSSICSAWCWLMVICALIALCARAAGSRAFAHTARHAHATTATVLRPIRNAASAGFGYVRVWRAARSRGKHAQGSTVRRGKRCNRWPQFRSPTHRHAPGPDPQKPEPGPHHEGGVLPTARGAVWFWPSVRASMLNRHHSTGTDWRHRQRWTVVGSALLGASASQPGPL
jgi:hypothetical protein